MSDLKTEIFNANVEIPLFYHRQFEGPGKPLLIFFHGFTDSAQSFLRRAYPVETSDYEVLAINGPFPTPVKAGSTWKKAYSWYFFDTETGKMFVPPGAAVSGIVQLLKHLGLEDRMKVLVGFSQGGFFLPFVFQKLSNVKQMIGIGAAYRFENYPDEGLSAPMHAIHGVDDEVVPYDQAKESFVKLEKKNPAGIFYSVPALKHTMNDEARSLFQTLISDPK